MKLHGIIGLNEENSYEPVIRRNRQNQLATPLKWHEDDRPWTPERWVTAIVGELGEMANITKKLFRARDGAVGILKGETIETLEAEERKEWADTMHYMILFAMSQGWNMTEALREVFNAKSEQLGFEEHL